MTFHGVASPTGLERTYPNLLNSEAVMNLEYDKWNEGGVPPEHDVTVPLTRMLAGPMDYHQGIVSRRAARRVQAAREADPLVIGTPCRMLATYVVFQNHLPMMADYPTRLSRSSADESRWPRFPPPGTRRGPWRRRLASRSRSPVAAAQDWWIGAMTDRKERELQLAARVPRRRQVSRGDLSG